MAAKRRLPVVQSPAEEPEEPRPPWHWVGFGVVGIFFAWLPLAWIAGKISSPTSLVRTIVPQFFGLAIAAMAGGYLVGRWGSGPREAAIAGATAGVLATLLALTSGTGSFALAIVIALAAFFAWLGGRLGARRKTP